MSKGKVNPEMIDEENPEWTEEQMRAAMRFSDLPASLQRKLKGRGPQKAPTKERITIRLSPEVVKYFRGTGAGWQSRMDEELLKIIKRRG